jgi:ABC-2 type transport system ATP-binding protein
VGAKNGVDAALARYGALQPSENGGKRAVQVPAGQVAQITAQMLAELPVLDLLVEDPPIEDVIEQAFQE